jgi:hypothetical protein
LSKGARKGQQQSDWSLQGLAHHAGGVSPESGRWRGKVSRVGQVASGLCTCISFALDENNFKWFVGKSLR